MLLSLPQWSLQTMQATGRAHFVMRRRVTWRSSSKPSQGRKHPCVICAQATVHLLVLMRLDIQSRAFSVVKALSLGNILTNSCPFPIFGCRGVGIIHPCLPLVSIASTSAPTSHSRSRNAETVCSAYQRPVLDFYTDVLKPLTGVPVLQSIVGRCLWPSMTGFFYSRTGCKLSMPLSDVVCLASIGSSPRSLAPTPLFLDFRALFLASKGASGRRRLGRHMVKLSCMQGSSQGPPSGT
ncbi:hypothetical protein CC79DRAFT_770368 [Sarocladium strictum]